MMEYYYLLKHITETNNIVTSNETVTPLVTKPLLNKLKDNINNNIESAKNNINSNTGSLFENLKSWLRSNMTWHS